MSRRLRLISAGAGALALVILAILASQNASAALRWYLVGFTFWVGLSLGALGLALIQFLTGGHWGLVARRILESAAGTLPVMAVLFLPLVIGLPALYAWARPAEVAADPILGHKAIYLNVPFWLIRAALYFGVWISLSWNLRRLSAEQDRADDPRHLQRLQRFSVIAALVLALTVTFAAIDWWMSLDADWYSTMYPPMIATGDLLVALAFAIVATVWLSRGSTLRDVITPGVYNDLGSLMLALLMLCAYMAYFQYLLIWAGNLSDEIPWYVRRVQGGWLPVALWLVVFGFAVPFWCLLFRPLKRNPRSLVAIAGLIFVTQVVNVYWLLAPVLQPAGPVASDAFALLAVVGVGGLWFAAFGWQLERLPLLPANDPRLVVALEAAREPA